MQQPSFSRIGKYEIADLVGEGAMGVVYRANDPILGRPVAIKVMSEGIASDDELRERFRREARAAGSLQHPNIITIYDFGETEGHLFIAMEFVEGDDLESLLERGESLTLDQKLGIVIDVLAALDYAHRRGVVHRDIKPANIRLTADGRTKLMDFGIAHLASSNATRTGIMLGTPNYMAPEQVTGGTISPATDIFAVGAVLYELLGGHRPFRADSLHAVLFKVLGEDPRPLAEIDPSLPRELDSIVRRALAKDPAARPESALDMANALSAVRATLGGSTTMSTISLRTPASGAYRIPTARASRSRPWGGMPALIGVAGLGVAISIGALVVAARSRSQPAAPPTVAALDSPRTIGVPLDAGPPASDVAVPRRDTATTSAPSGTRGSRAPTSTPVTQPRPRDAGASSRPTPKGAAEAQVASAPAPGRITPADRSRTDSARAVVPPLVAPPVSAPPIRASTSSNPTAAPPPSVPPATAATAAGATPNPERAAAAEIERLVAEYARAIESRDMAAVRRAYGGLTDAQQRNFDDFFRAVRGLRVTFTLASLDVNGATADGRVSGAYDYTSESGRAEHQPVAFRVSFAREGGVWRMTAVR